MPSARRTVLISGAFAAATATPLIPLGTHALRGIAAPCAVFTVRGLGPVPMAQLRSATPAQAGT